MTSTPQDFTPFDDEIKDALITYEAAIYEDNSDEESIELSRAALLDVLRRCRDAGKHPISEKTTILPPADASGKRPRLFYYEETENCWCPAEGLEVENIISADNFLSNGEIVEIQFKREDMTDADFDAIPEG